jgi:hypothetical protein
MISSNWWVPIHVVVEEEVVVLLPLSNGVGMGIGVVVVVEVMIHPTWRSMMLKVSKKQDDVKWPRWYKTHVSSSDGNLFIVLKVSMKRVTRMRIYTMNRVNENVKPFVPPDEMDDGLKCDVSCVLMEITSMMERLTRGLSPMPNSET